MILSQMGNKRYPKPQVFDHGDMADAELKKLFTSMLRIRLFEEKIARLVERKEIKTPCHLYIGQEAVAVGVCSALKKDDYISGTHRSHGHYLAKGGDMKKAMAEIFCRATGCSGGRGGSMHLVSPDIGIMGTSAIMGGSVPMGVGSALAEFIRGGKRISVVFHGDGVPEEGVWSESLNLAAIKKLPVLFLCENNYYCTHLPLEERRLYDNIPELAEAHGVPSISIDGNDVLEVFRKTSQIVEEIRSGGGPKFIECKTYRWLGHVGHKDDLDVGLRSLEEVQAWRKNCPVRSYERYLLNKGFIDEKERDFIYNAVRDEISEALEYALSSPYPSMDNVLKDVYK